MSSGPQDALDAGATPPNLRQENERLLRELAQARAELEDFTHSVSHDLRASLRHVNAYVQIVVEELGDQLPATSAAHLETVRQAARQMGRQIDGLTELSRLARVQLHLSPVDIGQLMQDVLVAMSPALLGRPTEVQIAPDFPTLRCDGTLVREVLTQLLSNALKFTASRSAAQIKVEWQAAQNGLCAVTVSDNGVGFNSQYADKLFHAFQRLHSAREFEGMGMGLAMTRKIVERHGGTVWASGAINAGCRVSFTLPMA